MKKLIIFDFWGTLIENGVRPSPSKQVRYFLRLRMPFSEFIHGFEEAFMTKHYENLKDGFVAVTDSFDKRIPDFVYDKLVGMWNKFTILSKPFEETIEALEELSKEYDLAILSNTDNFSVPQVLDKFDMKKYFKYVHLSCDTGKLKSDPTSFEDLLKEAGVSKEDAIMIGDSPQSDIKGAQAAEVDAVLIDRRGWCEDQEMTIISSLKDIKGLLKGETSKIKKKEEPEEVQEEQKE